MKKPFEIYKKNLSISVYYELHPLTSLSCHAHDRILHFVYYIRHFYTLYTSSHWRLRGQVEYLLLHTQEDPGSIPVQNFIFVPLFKVFFFLYFLYPYCLNVLIKCSLHFVRGFFFLPIVFFVQLNEIAWITTGQVQCIVRKAGWLNWYLSITFSYICDGTCMYM